MTTTRDIGAPFRPPTLAATLAIGVSQSRNSPREFASIGSRFLVTPARRRRPCEDRQRSQRQSNESLSGEDAGEKRSGPGRRDTRRITLGGLHPPRGGTVGGAPKTRPVPPSSTSFVGLLMA